MQEALEIQDKKEYELAYVLTGEEGIPEIDKALSGAGVSVINKPPASSIRLAYPVNKHESGYFGYAVFSATPEEMLNLKSALALNPKVLRSLIVTPPVKPPVRYERALKPETKAGEPPTASPSTLPPLAPEPQILTNEGLEKKLEEILK